MPRKFVTPDGKTLVVVTARNALPEEDYKYLKRAARKSGMTVKDFLIYSFNLGIEQGIQGVMDDEDEE